ncbi:MAG: ATP-binding cassette domain-containing protein, partial [Clostridiales bacterium]|nr:ATP-binding cassette domain-containing protein [Clostridiales bacterium]
MTAPIVEMRGITKIFPGVVANDRVDFSVRKGEIHALLGENGAGKSTLMNVLSGIYKPTDGEIILRGEPVSFQSPRDALSHKIGMIHQHFRLVKAFTVTENIMLGARVSALLNRKKMDKDVVSLAERYNMPVDPQARIWQLSVGERQRVEILKALYRKA